MSDDDSVSDEKNNLKNKSGFRCTYCGKKMNRFDYETYHGICGKCREVVDWKDILKQVKE